MALFKCKMCGGDLEIAEGVTIAECEYCGTKQTVPTARDENMQALFNRANTLRIKSEFDKAEKLYEKIIQSDPTQTEAYWGLILCKYGIEYVDDPATFKKVPTCHRASFESIVADDDYKSALKYADMSQRAIYEEQAKEIDRIQKDILALAQKEETYDVFICYKETDANGQRTQDSVIANDIYYQLTNEGFKAFYSAITLEGKLGSAYEPIIFAALNSAKVMLAIGTKPEHFNAVWVKNEWSRYLKIIKKDRSKLLIPCYRDMDAYELPEEFAHLQAQDMSKVGFINDLVRGIKKVIKKDESKATVVKETVLKETVPASATNTTPLLKRAFIFLEDADWKNANEYCEKVLDIDPEDAQAYLGKLMAELKVKKQEDLKNCEKTFDDRNNYQKAIRFGDDKLKTTLTSYTNYINAQNEDARLEDIYLKACKKMNAPQHKFATPQEKLYNKAAELFKSISGYKDSSILAERCLENAKIARAKKDRRRKRFRKIAIITTPIICAIIAFIIVLNVVIIPNIEYNNAIQLMNAGKYEEALIEFKSLREYKNSASNLIECKYLRAIQLIESGNFIEAYDALVALDGYRDSVEKAASIHFEYEVEKLKSAKVGDYVFFGAYEQDDDTSNGKESVEWLVLESKGNKLLVISKHALDCQPYNTTDRTVTWEKCTLRTWLNNDFINSAFSNEEKSLIPTVTVYADKNSTYSTDSGNNTLDQVFLLSIPQANDYFSDGEGKCPPSRYAKSRGVNPLLYFYWLRTPGATQNYAAVRFCGGTAVDTVEEDGLPVNSDKVAVRPAMWIDLSKVN